MIDGFMPKIEEWVERSNGRVRGDVVFDKLVAVGFEGSDRTVRRGLAAVKLNWKAGRRRVYRPWVVEPGMWAQWDWGHGPKIAGRQTYLFCAWLAWCRFRIVFAVWDKTLPTVISCLDRSMRAFGGVPTYWLTDNERTVSTGHIAGIAMRHPLIVQVGHHYGVTVATCVPADPETKGGVERTVQIAKADLVPTDTNLRDDYASWAELVEACAEFMIKVNGREHRVTRRARVDMLIEERDRLRRLPDVAFTAAFGETRKVSWTSTISFGGVPYSVPHTLADQVVWVRVDGDEIVATHIPTIGRCRSRQACPVDAGEPAHRRRPLSATPGRRVGPPAPADERGRSRVLGTRCRRPDVVGRSRRRWASRVKVKMAEAVQLSRLHGVERVDWALGHAAMFERFADGDTASIIAAHPVGQRRRADEDHSMQPSTQAWANSGRPRHDRRHQRHRAD